MTLTTDATSSVAGGTLTVSGGAAITKKLFVGDAVSMTLTTDATSSVAGGTLTVSGGAAIAKKLFVGGDVTFSSRLMQLNSLVYFQAPYSPTACTSACSLDMSAVTSSLVVIPSSGAGSTVTWSITNCAKGYMFIVANEESVSLTFAGSTIATFASKQIICQSATTVYTFV
eukprot:TRINITY_DN5206_c0_g1_i5.p1 TRINITY_DN5206_c0_g1~~TRINITY_DN5206_c0_g1_i5.p1  ORF type:complete len:195 (-),score=55.11 TRINITY_DN5206_c0_g1_i5:177-689(-)